MYNTSISGCPSCHGPPKKVDNNYTNFNHTSHLSRVPKNKCFSCHNIKERVERYDDFNFVHKNHVTNNKIACYNCHSEVKHMPTIKENLCSTCHSNQHPKNWLIDHKTRASTGDTCNECHQPKFCADCHVKVVAQGKKIT